MFPVVGLTISVLRVAANASLLFEAQRLLLLIVRPTRGDAVEQLENHLLQKVRTRVEHRWVSDGSGNKIHILEAQPIAGPTGLPPDDNVNQTGFEQMDKDESKDTDAAGNSTGDGEDNKAGVEKEGEEVGNKDGGGDDKGLSGNMATSAVASSSSSPMAPPTPPPIALLLHGHSMSAAFWYRNVDDLVGLGFRVLALDLIGWGRSQRPRFRPASADASVAFFVDSVSSVVDALIPPRAAITIIGHSLGAYVGFEYAKRLATASDSSSPSVQRLVLVSPAATIRSISFARAVYFSLPPQAIVRRGGLIGFLTYIANYPRAKPYRRDRLPDLTYRLAMQRPPSGEIVVRAIIAFQGLGKAECIRPLVEQVKPRLEVPTLIVGGDSDSAMPIEGIKELYRGMKDVDYNVAITIFDDCDHCPQFEKPEQFSQALVSFLNAHPPPPSDLDGSHATISTS